MEIDRRTFLSLVGAAAVAPAGVLAADEQLYLAARARGGRHEVAVLDARGVDRLVLPIEDRGHSFAIDPVRRTAVAFARAPGRYAVGFDIEGKGLPQPLVAAPGRHFFGHGIFSADGRLMFASENDYEAGRGVTGIYDVDKGFARLGEFDCGGIGPHDVVLMPDGRTACVANGGILTHPDYDKLKLNIDTMSPSLAYLDLASGDIVEQVALPKELHKLSIRHLVVDAHGAVWFGCQHEGEASDRPPLVGRHRRGREAELFAGPPDLLRRMDNYVGSVSVDASGEVVAISSPLGGLVAFWDAATGRYLGEQSMADVCGVAPLKPGHVLGTTGRGAINDMSPWGRAEIVEESVANPAWDNHLRRV
ncbi:MAG: DUF1513 domain-containing protein [Mesorhizobium sp.]|nr:DUF1513 domain-containing protein [Mesorhizobium sp.]